jgi:hypothetical protein
VNSTSFVEVYGAPKFLYQQHSVYMATEWAHTFDVHIGAIFPLYTLIFFLVPVILKMS